MEADPVVEGYVSEDEDDDDHGIQSMEEDLSFARMNAAERLEYGFRPESTVEFLDDELDEGTIPSFRRHVHTIRPDPQRFKYVQTALEEAKFPANSLEVILVNFSNVVRNDYALTVIDLMTRLVTPALKHFRFWFDIRSNGNLGMPVWKEADAILSKTISQKGLKHMKFQVIICLCDFIIMRNDSIRPNAEFLAKVQSMFPRSKATAAFKGVDFQVCGTSNGKLPPQRHLIMGSNDFPDLW